MYVLWLPYEILHIINYLLHYLIINTQELEDYEKRGIINLRVAFSRDQERKIYVTHLLEQDTDLIWNVIGENKGHFYICG